ncbi:hypothetical protein DYB32_010682, partial [Aphanomyces invadans]
IYNGKASEAVAYFASQGLPCPTYMNPTDYFMRQIIVLDPQSEAATRVERLAQAWKTRPEGDKERAAPLHAWTISPRQSPDGVRLAWWSQLRVLCGRNFRRIVRDKLEFQARVVQTVCCSVLVGLIYLQMAVDQAGIQGYSGALFLVTIMFFFNHTKPEFATVPLELPMLDREYRGGLYNLWVWYVAKNASEAGFQSLLVYIVLLTSAAVGLGYMTSCMTRHPHVANIVGITIMLPMMIFGGFFLNASTSPVYLIWLEYLSPLKYCFRGMSRAFWTSVDVIPCAQGQVCVATTGADVLASLSLDEYSMAIDVAALIGVNVFFRSVGALWLWHNLRGSA